MADQVFNAKNARVRVFTFKDGLLSKIAHDLEIDVERFSISVALGNGAPRSIDARFDLQSLRVLHALVAGRAVAMSESDKKTIRANIDKDVLQTSRFPEAVFRANEVTEEAGGHRVMGQLTLHGETRNLVARVQRMESRHQCEIDVFQPEFGIKPYSAMLGALRVQPRIRVRVETLG